jgi:cell division protein FtsI (penicillin-binding protein 3)
VIANSAATIASRATLAQLNAVNDLSEIAFEYPEQQRRLYPQGSIAAHVLGFVTPGRGGAMGVERSFNQRLTAPSTRGTALALSLDTRVQAALDLELGNAVTQLEAAGGAALVLDVTSGEVLAMSSYPTFDPNNVRFATPEAQWNGVTYSTFELGSSFKPITMAAAMDAGVVTDLSRRYDATRPLMVGGHPIRDSHPSNRWLNVPETLIHSSNIVTAQIADRLGADRLRATFRSVGFDRRPTIELAERGMPQWATPWGRTTTMTAGFGHSITVTPLHLATAYAALVNGGMYHPPTIIKRDANAPVPGHRVFTEATSSRMRQLLRLIVTDGTGARADAPGFLVGGKTGSAERAVGGRYVGNSVVATFAGVFPMNRPRYVVLVMIDRPPGNAYSMGQRTAAYTAAPVVRRTVQRIGPMLGIYPDMRRDLDLSDLRPLIWRPAGDRAARRPAVAVDAQ